MGKCDHNAIQLIITGSGFLAVGKQRGAVRFYTSTMNGELPVIGEALGDQALMDAAWRAERVLLEVFGMRFRIEIRGVNQKNGAVTFWVAPVFKALSKAIEPPKRAARPRLRRWRMHRARSYPKSSIASARH